MRKRDFFRKISKKGVVTTHCACGGKLLWVSTWINYCSRCGQDYSRVQEGENLFEPVFNFRQLKIMGRKV